MATAKRILLLIALGLLGLSLPDWLDAQVPESPPAGVPDSIRARAAASGSRSNLILVAFDVGTTPAQKDSAMAQISGQVVGGLPLNRTELDGWYVVRLEGATRAARTSAARRELAYLPWVRLSGTWSFRTEWALEDLTRAVQDPAGDVLAVEIRERSVWGGLEARFAPFRSEVRRIRVNGVSPAAGPDQSRTWSLGTVRQSNSEWGEIIAAPDGTTDLVRAPRWVGEPGVSDERIFGATGPLGLPESSFGPDAFLQEVGPQITEERKA